MTNRKFSNFVQQELVGSKSSSGCKKGLIIATVLVVVVGLSIGAIYYLNKKQSDPSTVGSSIQLADYLENKLFSKKNNATWLSNTELTYRDSDVSVSTYIDLLCLY